MRDIAVVMKLPASINLDRDYVLGTHDEELARLGLQHRVWLPVVVDCWQLARVMPKGSLSIFHEYGHYETWRFLPRLPMQERFREHVIATWRESGGEPDGAARLSELLADNGFAIRSARPHVFCLRPRDYMWQWPATFIEIYLPRLIQMGRIDQSFADQVRAALANAEKNPNALMITPLVLEIIAEKL